jgi:hypothetical protein
MINILGVINCMENKKILKEIHVIELEGVGLWDGKDKNGKRTGGVLYSDIQKYIGKIILNEDWSFEVKMMNIENKERREKRWLEIMEENKEGYLKENSKLTNQELINSILRFMNTSNATRTIKAEVGEKYYKNGWIESRGRELRDAIEYLDKYPLYFEDVEEGTKEIEEEKQRK